MSNLGEVSTVQNVIDSAEDEFDVADSDDADSAFDAPPVALTAFHRAPGMFDPAAVTPSAFSEIEVGSDLLLGDEADWHERALCAQTDPEAFFPEKGGSTREAKKICTGCEVRAECLTYALANDERFGIWGGLSERERRRLKRSVG
ncbi:hypothetical protein ABIB25_003930 [Nakamurella sp. UYEF19]